MKISSKTVFVATLLEESRGYKRGTSFKPKGVYWHKNNVILVGDVERDDVIRLAFPAKIVDVSVWD